MDQIIRHLKQSNHILIATHNNPDGDAIGSLVAMGLSMETFNKKTTLCIESSIPAIYRFLPSVDRIVRSIGNRDEIYDTAIIVDCGDLQRIGKAASIASRIPIIINIDHHITNTRFGKLQLIDTSACAAAEIIYRLIRKMGVRISKAIATCIYTGILTDTGSFRFSNTNRAAFEICQEMIDIGVDPSDVAQHVYGTYSLGRIKLLNLALDSIEISQNGKLSVMTLTQNMLEETGTQPEDIDGFINYARIDDVKVAVLIQENSDGRKKSKDLKNFNVSLRSDGTVDVAKIASSFGGGGHYGAAGFSIDSTLHDLKSRIIQLSEKL
jgi:phosphoesterase RecJ-like protein